MKKILLGVLASSTIMHSAEAQGCAPKMVLLEMCCARNCGPCTFHLQDVKELYNEHKSTMAMIYYAQAPIGIGSWGQPSQPYQAFFETFNMDYQSSTMVDRTFFPGNYDNQEGTDCEAVADEEIAYNAQMASTYVPVSIAINHTYNPTTRQVNADITGNFCDQASGDIRFYVAVVQDTVIGEGVDYAQNAFSESSAINMGYSDFIEEGGALWINRYDHIQVLKYFPSGFFGNQGVIPGSVTAGQSFTENYTFTLPQFGSPDCVVPVDPEHAEIIVACVKYGPFGQREVLNANKVKIVDPALSLTETTEDSFHFAIVGNPVNDNTLTLGWSSETMIKGDLILFDVSGKIVKVLEENVVVEGAFEKTYSMDNATAGIYFVGFKTHAGKQYSRKIIVQ